MCVRAQRMGCAGSAEQPFPTLLPRSLPTETGTVGWQILIGIFGRGVEDAVPCEPLPLGGQESPEVLG